MLTAPADAAAARPATRLARSRPWLTRERIAGYLFIAPSLTHFLIFTVYLMLSSLVISTWTWDLLTPHRQTGLYNYTTLLFHDPIFRTAFRNTLLLAVFTIGPGMVLGLALAMVVNTKLRGISIFRAAYFLPVVVPAVATAIIFRWLYNPDVGVLNWFLGLFGVQHHDWLGNPSTALPSIAAM